MGIVFGRMAVEVGGVEVMMMGGEKKGDVCVHLRAVLVVDANGCGWVRKE